MPAEVATKEQIEADIERVRTLINEGNDASASTLARDTEGLVKGLTGRGSAAAKRRYLGDLDNALTPVSAAVATMETTDYHAIEGVDALIGLGAEKIAAGVKQLISNAELAREIGWVQLDIHSRMRDKRGMPDLKAGSAAAKDANRDLYRKAGELLEGDEFDVEQAVERLVRSVYNVKSDVRAQYLRGLDDSKDEAKLYAGILADAPKGTPVSAAVASYYGFPLKGRKEIAREDRERERELEAQGKTADEEPAITTPAERVSSVVTRLRRDFKAATPDDFESLSEEEKADVRSDLEELNKALKAMLAAVL